MACCIIVFAAVLLVNQSLLASHANNWQLVPSPQPYTELYFTDHRQLPAAVRPGAPQKLPFTIHSHEHKTTDYSFRVIAAKADGDGPEYQLAQGIVALDHGQTLAKDPTFTLPPLGRQIVIKVILDYEGQAYSSHPATPQTQSIHYRVDMVGIPSPEATSHED